MNRKVDITHTAVPDAYLLKDAGLERRVQRIFEMVESGATFVVRDLAAEFHLSPAYLQRLFKHETGVCLGVWLSEQRLQRAAFLLSNSYLSVKEITHTVGYEHTSSFVRAFERRFQRPPARFRKQAEGNYSNDKTGRTKAA
jgi:two-component system response regulator YesN